MNRINYIRDVFFYHQSNAGHIIHSMQEFKQTGQWLDKWLSRIVMIILVITMIMMIMDTAPDLPRVTMSCQSRYPLREIGDLGPCLSTSNPTHIIGECANQFIDRLLSSASSEITFFYIQYKNSISFIAHIIHNLRSDDLKLPIGHLVCIFCRI